VLRGLYLYHVASLHAYYSFNLSWWRPLHNLSKYRQLITDVREFYVRTDCFMNATLHTIGFERKVLSKMGGLFHISIYI
jgi:hypothetical protein